MDYRVPRPPSTTGVESWYRHEMVRIMLEVVTKKTSGVCMTYVLFINYGGYDYLTRYYLI